jgi:sulfur dioxygenase
MESQLGSHDVIFRQFHAADGQLSYLFADSVTRHAAVLDPHLSLEHDYLEMIQHLDLKLKFVIETHAHESHFSAAPLLCDETGARWIMSRLIAGTVQAQPLEHGECVFIGEEYFGALETPGHSACSMCFSWRNRVFTGHTLLVGHAGDCGRPDADAIKLYESIMHCLYVLPEETLVYPGAESAGCQKSTISFERENNHELKIGTGKEHFVNLKKGTGVSRHGAARQAYPGPDLYPFRKVSRT